MNEIKPCQWHRHRRAARRAEARLVFVSSGCARTRAALPGALCAAERPARGFVWRRRAARPHVRLYRVGGAPPGYAMPRCACAARVHIASDVTTSFTVRVSPPSDVTSTPQAL